MKDKILVLDIETVGGFTPKDGYVVEVGIVELDIKTGVESVKKVFEDSVSDFEIPAVSESPIMDVFMYDAPEESEGVEPTGED